MEKQKLTEKEIQNFVLDYLNANRLGYFWRNNTVGVYDPRTQGYRRNKNEKGVPDILGVLEGRFIAIECKSQGRNVLGENQEKFKERFERQGGIFYLANDVNSFVIWVQELKYSLKNNFREI